MTEQLMVFLKGAAMGAANVIPGVSGGTVAFITGIYERLIEALKSFDITAAKALFGGRVAEFVKRVDLIFLIWLALGVLTSFLLLAKLLEYLFENHQVFVWAFFFGLILASIFFVGREVKRWSAGAIIMLILGASIAIAIALLKPASENTNLAYLVLCGVAAMASMIIPGLSGSFVLLLMGNYFLVLRAVNDRDIGILVPIAVGAVVGLLALSHLLAWVFRHHHNVAVSLLTGFVAGSLLLIWPWKKQITTEVTIDGKIESKVTGYEWLAPEMSMQTLAAVGLIVVGFLAVWLMEKAGGDRGGKQAGDAES